LTNSDLGLYFIKDKEK